MILILPRTRDSIRSENNVTGLDQDTADREWVKELQSGETEVMRWG